MARIRSSPIERDPPPGRAVADALRRLPPPGPRAPRTASGRRAYSTSRAARRAIPCSSEEPATQHQR
eukprot:tig00000178_g12804.t1